MEQSEIILDVNDDEVTLKDFIDNNTVEGVLDLTDEEMKAVLALQIADKCFIGHSTILRVK